MMVEAMMDKNKRMLAKYSQQHVIHCNGESGESSDESEIGQVPTMRESRLVIAEHENQIERFRSKYSQEVHTLKDYKMLQGVYTKDHLSKEFIERVKKVTPSVKTLGESPNFINSNIKGSTLPT